MSTASPIVTTPQRQLTVMVGGQSYALPGENVIEVLRRPRLTRVPHGPPALLGVSNLRGSVLPVVSLAKLMGSEPGREERVVVLDHAGAVGLLVDAVLHLSLDANEGTSGQIDLPALLEVGFKRAAGAGSGRQQIAPAQAEAQPGVDQRVLLSFMVSGQNFALPLDAVIEAMRLPEAISRVAGGDAAVIGVGHVRDRALPLISLATLLGFPPAENDAGHSRVLLVDHEGGRLGLVVDAIEAIVRLDEAMIDAVPPILQRGRGQAELDAIGRQSGGRPLISILSVPRLFTHAAVQESVASTRRETQEMLEPSSNQAKEQFVVFDLGEERYGLPIGAVQEVLRLPETVTRLPNGPQFVRGIINLRGRPVPLIDQRQRFDAPLASGTIQPRVIIVSVGDLQAGFVVDAVSEIVALASDSLAATPSLSSEQSTVFNRVANVGSDGRLILLIDPDELLSRAEQDILADIAARKAPVGPA